MARTKKTETKKTTTKKTTKKSTKKVVEEFPVDDIINDLKGTLITENSDKIGSKKKFKEDVKEKQQETNEEVKTFEDELLEKCINTEGDIEAVETVNVDEIIKDTADKLREEIKEEEVEEPVVDAKEEEPKNEVKENSENKKDVFLKKMRKIVTSHKWMGQIIDF